MYVWVVDLKLEYLHMDIAVQFNCFMVDILLSKLPFPWELSLSAEGIEGVETDFIRLEACSGTARLLVPWASMCEYGDMPLIPSTCKTLKRFQFAFSDLLQEWRRQLISMSWMLKITYKVLHVLPPMLSSVKWSCFTETQNSQKSVLLNSKFN